MNTNGGHFQFQLKPTVGGGQALGPRVCWALGLGCSLRKVQVNIQFSGFPYLYTRKGLAGHQIFEVDAFCLDKPSDLPAAQVDEYWNNLVLGVLFGGVGLNTS